MVWPKYVWCPKNLFLRCPDRGNHHLVIRMPELDYWVCKIQSLNTPTIIWLFQSANDVLKAGKNGRPAWEKPLGQMDKKQLARTHSSLLWHRHETWTLTGNNEGRRLYHLCSPNLSFPFLPTSTDRESF